MPKFEHQPDSTELLITCSITTISGPSVPKKATAKTVKRKKRLSSRPTRIPPLAAQHPSSSKQALRDQTGATDL
jgi:hypothetical protein